MVITAQCHPWHRDIAYMDAAIQVLPGATILTVLPVHKKARDGLGL